MKKFLLIAVVLLAGCAAQKKEVVSPPVEAQVVSPEPVETRTYVPVQQYVPVQESQTHVVKKGECLWKISENEYGDPFRWPMIFKSNMDKIKNPHWIYPKQVFKIDEGQSEEKVKEAHKEARGYAEGRKRVKSSKRSGISVGK
jgi:nucleoid-associated protein YgaU